MSKKHLIACWTAGAILLATAAFGSPGQSPAASVDQECQEHLKALAFALIGYLGEHEGKLPAKIGDLYRSGYILDLGLLTCPASGRKIANPSDIDTSSDYKLVGALTAKRPHLLVQDVFGGHGGMGFAYYSNQKFERIALPAPAAGAPERPDKPVVDKPRTDKPASGPPAADKPAAGRPAVDKPVPPPKVATGRGGEAKVVTAKPETPAKPRFVDAENPSVALTNVELGAFIQDRPDLGPFVKFTGSLIIPGGDTGHTDQVVVYFYSDAGGGAKGAPLYSLNAQYADTNGFAACATAVYPIPYEGVSTTWQCWIPYSALAVPAGGGTSVVADAVLFVDGAFWLRTPPRSFIIQK